MTETTYNYSPAQWRTYVFALAFIIGNLALPQLVHLVPKGGLIFLPIYFFTLIGAYKYGFWVGLLTAILSPLANMLLFGMPPMEKRGRSCWLPPETEPGWAANPSSSGDWDNSRCGNGALG